MGFVVGTLPSPALQQRSTVVRWVMTIRHSLWRPSPDAGLWRVMVSTLSIIYNPMLMSLHLLNVVNMFPLLESVLKAVTVNARSLVLTAILCAIVVYLFGLMGFVLFPEDFTGICSLIRSLL